MKKTKNVLITGGTGLVGREIMSLLLSKGYKIAVLSRKKHVDGIRSYFWNYENNIIDKEAVEFADVIIHLAGEGIANKRWSRRQKKRIRDSRVKTTKLLFDSIEQIDNKPQLVISASAVGYYGMNFSEKLFNEEDGSGDDFLAEIVREWEESVQEFTKHGIRCVYLRLGMVLSCDGGLLKKITKPLRFRVLAIFGNGKQYVPWIAIHDLAKMFLFVMENQQISGIYNAVSPKIVTNKEFIKELSTLHKKSLFVIKLPSVLIKLIFGKRADLLLKGNKVSSQKISSAGFKFQYKSLNVFFRQINNFYDK